MNSAHRGTQAANDSVERAELGYWNESLVAIYIEHFDRLVNELTLCAGGRPAAEDAVQDAFVAFHTRGAQPAPGREVAYLATSARNNVLMRLRGDGRRREILAANEPSVLRAPSAESQALLVHEVTSLAANIAALPPQQSSVIALRHVRGLSVAETADQLGVSDGTVKTHAHRALRTLRSIEARLEAA